MSSAKYRNFVQASLWEVRLIALPLIWCYIGQRYTETLQYNVYILIRWDLFSALHTGTEIRVLQVTIGTTHFVNAVIQRRHLVPVSVIRIGGTDTASLPPYTGFPPDLEKVGQVQFIDGWHQIWKLREFYFWMQNIHLYVGTSFCINSLWSSDAIWRHRSGSTLAQIKR